jgi:uncharacterized protein (TIGR02118 family)
MIKSISLLTRKLGLTHEQFMKHWFEIHAPLALKVPGIRRYVQLQSAATPEAKALYADGALFIGSIKSFITEEKQIIPA